MIEIATRIVIGFACLWFMTLLAFNVADMVTSIVTGSVFGICFVGFGLVSMLSFYQAYKLVKT